METFMQESSSTPAIISGSRKRSRGKPGGVAGRGLTACMFVVALSACSADGAAEAEPANTSPAAATPSSSSAVDDSAVAKSDLAEPDSARIELDGVSPSGEKVLSEQGTGTGTHVFDGVLEAGQVLSLSASCTPGDSVTISYGMGSYGVDCSTPATSFFYNAPSSEDIEDVEVTVRTADGSPYWLAAWVHEAQ